MGACGSKPNVLDSEAPEVAPEIVASKDAMVEVKEEVVKKEKAIIAEDDNVGKSPSLDNLTKNQEEKGLAEEKEETSVKASKVASPEMIELDVEKVVDGGSKTNATNCPDEKKTEEEKLETPNEKNMEEVMKPSVKSENKVDDQEKLSEEDLAEKTIEEVKPDVTNDMKTEENPSTTKDLSSEAEKKKIEEKPAATKKGKFWWDK